MGKKKTRAVEECLPMKLRSSYKELASLAGGIFSPQSPAYTISELPRDDAIEKPEDAEFSLAELLTA